MSDSKQLDKAIRRELNVRLLAITLVLAALVVLAAFFWHKHELGPLAEGYWDRAGALEANNQPAAAAEYLFRYINLRPEDSEGHIRLAMTFDRAAKNVGQKAQAIRYYNQALGLAPDRVEMRRRLAELLVELGRYPEAKHEAKQLLDGDARDAVAKRVKALALYGQTRLGDVVKDKDAGGIVTLDQAIDAFRDTLESAPGDLDLAFTLAEVYRRESRPPRDLEADKLEADNVVNRAVAAAQSSSQSLLARYSYRKAFDLPDRDPDLDEALKQSPDDVNILLAVAERFGADKNWKDASDIYARMIKQAPTDRRGYLGLGQCYVAQGQVPRAIEVWEQGLSKAIDNDLILGSMLAQALIEQRRWDEATKVLDKMDAAERMMSLQITAGQQTSLRSMLDFLRAAWWGSQGEYFRAVRLLEPIAVLQGRTQEIQVDTTRQSQILTLLANCYAGLGQLDRAASTFERVVALQPNRAEPRLAAARAWTQAGQFDKALNQYRLADAQSSLSDDARLAIAQALFQEQFRLPAEKRMWKEFEQVLAKIPDDGPEAWRKVLLKADRAVADGKSDEAWKLLQASEKAFPDTIALHQVLVLAFEQLGHVEDSNRALARLEQLDGTKAQTILTHADLLLHRKQEAEAEKVVREALDRLPADQQEGLKFRVCQHQLWKGDIKAARKGFAELAEQTPKNLGLMQQSAELALEAADLSDAEQWEKKIRAAEGEDGTLWRYYRARRLLLFVDKELASLHLERSASSLAAGRRDSRLDAACAVWNEVLELAEQLEHQRPSWTAAHVLKGMVFEFDGKTEDAIKAYQSAIALGDRRTALYEQLVRLLYQAQKFEEAERLLSQLKQVLAQSQELSSLAISDSVRKNEIADAVSLAKNGVQQRPQDPIALIWLGQTQLLAERPAEAEQALRDAVRLAPEDIRTWNALFVMLLRTEQRDTARETLKEMADKAKLNDIEREFALAQGYELLGDLKEAEENYRKAERLAPNNVAIQRRLAAFLLKTDVAQAKTSLRNLMTLSPETGAARRTLAAVLVASGKDADWQEAMQLLSRPNLGLDETPLDQRLKAVLLIRHSQARDPNAKDSPEIAEATKILGGLVENSQKSVVGDHLLLASLYEGQDKLQKARDQFLKVVNQSKPEPAQVTAYIEFLLRPRSTNEGDPESRLRREEFARDAALWLKRLEEIDRDGFLALNMRARILHSQNRTAEIEKVVEPFVAKLSPTLKKDSQRVQLELSVARLYATVALDSVAMRHYRNAVKADSTTQAVIVLAQVLTRGRAQPEDFALAEPLFADALEHHGKDTRFLLAMTGVRYIQGQTEAVAELSRRILSIDPKHVVALNNLASLLAEKPESRAEALALIDRAIEISGNDAVLLDTKGMLLFYEGKNEQALKLLQEAVVGKTVDPRFYFHLALAYERGSDANLARENLRKATDAGLPPDVLTPKEKTLLSNLERTLGQPSKTGTNPNAPRVSP